MLWTQHRKRSLVCKDEVLHIGSDKKWVGPRNYSRCTSVHSTGGWLFKISRFKPRPYVPLSLRKKVIEICHNSKFAVHGGILATEAKVNQESFWRGILKDVSHYVRKCSSCQFNKRGIPQRVSTGKNGTTRESTITLSHTKS